MAKTAARSENNLTARCARRPARARRAAPAATARCPRSSTATAPTRSTWNSTPHDFAAVLRHSGTNAVLTLDIDGKEQLALTKALDIHPIRRNIQHADLLVVRRGEKVTVEVNVVIEGDAASGTLVTQDTNTIEIEPDASRSPSS